MLGNFLRTAFRHLLKHKLHTAINVTGLAVGLTCCTIILLYILDEVSYEKFHNNADRIVRIAENRNTDGKTSRLAQTYGPLSRVLDNHLELVEKTTRVLPYNLLLKNNEQQLIGEKEIFFVDSTFFDLFSFQLIAGDPRSVLNVPFSMILTQSAARQCFGEENPIGEIIYARDENQIYEFHVSGIVADPPANTHLQFEILSSFVTMRSFFGTWINNLANWHNPPLYTYALQKENVAKAEFDKRLNELSAEFLGPRQPFTPNLESEKLLDIRLYSNRENDIRSGSNILYIYIFAALAAFILILACINFINLATAIAVRRTREVGMRKTLGATRRQLIGQFLAESALLVFFAFLFVALLLELLLPVFNLISGKTLSTDLLINPVSPFVLLGSFIFVSLISGAYPALFLSSFVPAKVLKSSIHPGRHGAVSFRKLLVVFQFIISIVLIIGTAVIFRQLNYIRDERAGFDKEQVVLIPLRETQNQVNYQSLKNRFMQIPTVEAVTGASGVPGLNEGLFDLTVYPEGPQLDSLTMKVLTVDHDFASVLGLHIVKGRDFSNQYAVDARESLLMNESAAKRLGWDEPVGKKLTLRVWLNRYIRKEGHVVGLLQNFQYHSLHQAIDPIVFHILPNSYYYNFVAVRLLPGDFRSSLASMQKAWQEFNPHRPFEYNFLDQKFDALYRVEEKMGRLFGIFAGLALMIACLGLFGLSAFTAEQRTKEIGLRKVLGATVSNIILLISKDLLKLIAIAFTIAVPAGYFGMNYWLQNFAERISISWEIIVIAGLFTFLAAWLTVGFHAVRAAITNPVDSLRYD